MKIAVTGGNGDMGRSLIPYLLEQGHSVISIDRALPSEPFAPSARPLDRLIADTRDYGEFVASLRFHWLAESRERILEWAPNIGAATIRYLWAYTLLPEASRACLLSLTVDFAGHEVFYIVAPRTTETELSLDLARRYYPNVAIRSHLPGHQGFFNCAKAERILGWKHVE